MSKITYNHTAFVLYGPLSSFTAWVVQMRMRQDNGEIIPPVLPGKENVRVNEVAEGDPTSWPKPGKDTWMLLRWKTLTAETTPESREWTPPQPDGGGWTVWGSVFDRLDESESPGLRAEFVHSFDYRSSRTSRTMHRAASSYQWMNTSDGIMHIGPNFNIDDPTYDGGKDLTYGFIMET